MPNSNLVLKISVTCDTKLYYFNIEFCLSIVTAIFPGEPGLASTRISPFWILLELRMMELVVTRRAVRHAQLVKSSMPTNQHPSFYKPDALPVIQTTVSQQHDTGI